MPGITLNEKLLTAIEESLPQMQVDAIRTALNELDDLRDKEKSLNVELKANRELNADKSKRIDELMSEVNRLQADNTSLSADNKVMTERDIKNQVVVIQAELSGVKSTVDKFLKNTVYREELQHQVANTGTSISNQYVNGQTIPVPTPYTQHIPATDVKTTETDATPEEGESNA